MITFLNTYPIRDSNWLFINDLKCLFSKSTTYEYP